MHTPSIPRVDAQSRPEVRAVARVRGRHHQRLPARRPTSPRRTPAQCPHRSAGTARNGRPSVDNQSSNGEDGHGGGARGGGRRLQRRPPRRARGRRRYGGVSDAQCATAAVSGALRCRHSSASAMRSRAGKGGPQRAGLRPVRPFGGQFVPRPTPCPLSSRLPWRLSPSAEAVALATEDELCGARPGMACGVVGEGAPLPPRR